MQERTRGRVGRRDQPPNSVHRGVPTLVSVGHTDFLKGGTCAYPPDVVSGSRVVWGSPCCHRLMPSSSRHPRGRPVAPPAWISRTSLEMLTIYQVKSTR